MARARLLRQGELLALLEPGPALPMAARAAAVPLLAALLLETVEAETQDAGRWRRDDGRAQ